MQCNYPNCRRPAMWTPTIAIPTIRTVGIPEPVLSPLVHDTALMRRNQLDPAQHIRNYERMVREYKEQQNNLVHTKDPTYLIGREVCTLHKDTYNFLEWFGDDQWEALCEAAREHGCILDTVMITVTFNPLNWGPGNQYLEVER